MIILAFFLILFVGVAISLMLLSEHSGSVWFCEKLNLHIPTDETQSITTCKRCGKKLVRKDNGDYEPLTTE